LTTREIRTPEGAFTVTFFDSGNVSVDYRYDHGNEYVGAVDVLSVMRREEAVFYLRKLLDEVNFGPTKL
jgi:hypothetical protein